MTKSRPLDYFIGILAIVSFSILLFEKLPFLAYYSNVLKLINIVILSIFIFDIFIRFLEAENKPEFFKYNWFNLIVFIPLIQFFAGQEGTASNIIIRQLVVIVMLVSRTKKIHQFFNLFHLKPAQIMLFSFMFTIGSGAILLMMPIATNSGNGMSLIDALFTATSATCVTGLIVQDTSIYLSRFGQLVVLMLIQLGGLGIMTFSVSLAIVMGKRLNINQQIAMQDLLDQDTLLTAKSLTAFIIKMTLLIEISGAVFLFIFWKSRFNNTMETLYHSVFHSVSAFCNAGFSTFSDSLSGFKNDLPTNIIIAVLIIAGGLGFPVIRDLMRRFREKFINKKGRNLRSRIQTKIVVYGSLLLIILGTAAIYYFESNIPENTSVGLISSFFQSVSARTAGFNTVDIGKLSYPSLLVMIVLMFIGASPGSTGGGIKTTTFFVLWANMVNSLKHKNTIDAYKRTIPDTVIQKASNLFTMSLFIVISFCIALLYIEKLPFMDIVFETVSAFATVGLSTGITSALSDKGKFLITCLMFIGRLGPLTIAYALLLGRKKVKYFYPEEKILIG